MIPTFRNAEASHEHSRWVLEHLYCHDDFMESIGTMIDLGCGPGLDLEWWATRTTRDLDNPRPLNIHCTGVDLEPDLPMASQYKNIGYRSQDFEKPFEFGKRKFDVLWCHDSFQYVVNPFATLRNWWDMTSKNGMLCIMVPQTTNIEFNKQVFEQASLTYWHWTVVNLIHVLAITGWDTAAGFFRKDPGDPWINAVVYRDERGPLDPKTTTWYHLAEQNRLPESAVRSIDAHGYLRQQDLLLPWLDRSLQSFAAQ